MGQQKKFIKLTNKNKIKMKKTIKNLAIALTFVFATLTSFSQDLKGFTFHAVTTAFESSNFEDIYEINQLYQVSFTDGYLVHTIMNANTGLVSESQFYKITSKEVIRTMDGFEIKFKVRSGLSGSYFEYTLYTSDDYDILNFDDIVLQGGKAIVLKTYNQ